MYLAAAGHAKDWVRKTTPFSVLLYNKFCYANLLELDLIRHGQGGRRQTQNQAVYYFHLVMALYSCRAALCIKSL